MISIWWNIFVLFSPSFCFHHRLSWLDLCFLPVYAHLKKCARSMVEKHRNSHVQGYARQNDLSYHESINISGSFLFCFFHACRVGTLQPIPACIGKKASHCYKHNKCDAILLKTNSLEAYGSKTFCSKVEKMWRILFWHMHHWYKTFPLLTIPFTFLNLLSFCVLLFGTFPTQTLLWNKHLSLFKFTLWP